MIGDRPGHDERQALAGLVEGRLDGEDRGLGVERVEDRLDDEEVRAALDEPEPASRYAASSSSQVTLRAPGSVTSGEIEAVRFVGPIAPRT